MTRLQYIADLLLKALASPDPEPSPSHGAAPLPRKAKRAAPKKKRGPK